MLSVSVECTEIESDMKLIFNLIEKLKSSKREKRKRNDTERRREKIKDGVRTKITRRKKER